MGHRGLERTEAAFSTVDVSFQPALFFNVANNLLISTSQDPFICLPVHPLPGFPSSFCFKGIVTRISVIVILVLDSLVL